MKYTLRIFSSAILVLLLSQVAISQVWPVRVSGSMIPPHSLDLGVYAVDRSQDLVFNAQLIDPVEPSLLVTLELTIENDGEVVYKTDPNFSAAPITLNQFQQTQLNGTVLAQYLRPEALVGANNTGTGSVQIPEGFNTITLQVIGVERNVPVSNKFRIQSNFKLNQVPVLILPECEAKLEIQPTQNMIFNWSPMHIGSSNSPMPVEYEFELVQLPEGTYNANDAFESALSVYKTTTVNPSIIYGPAEPQLEVDKVYAWRVQAYSMLNRSSTLFQNDGYSQICSFLIYDGEVPNTNISGTHKPSPKGCEVFDTDYGPITNVEISSTPIQQGDKLKVGYFDLIIENATGGLNGYSGMGYMSVPMFNTKIKVEFTRIKINNDLRVVESEEIAAVVEGSFGFDRYEFTPSSIPSLIDKDYVVGLNSYFDIGKGMDRKVSKLNLADPAGQILPIAMDKEDDVDVIVIGAYFTPRNAVINLVSYDDIYGDNPARYAASAVQCTPYGVKSNTHLVQIGSSSAKAIKRITDAFYLAQEANDGSDLDCDCEGIKDNDKNSKINISRDLIIGNGAESLVSLALKDKSSKPQKYIGEVEGVSEFSITTLPDYKLSAQGAELDLDKSVKSDGTATEMDNYENNQKNDWRGLVMDKVSMTIPDRYNFTDKPSIVLDQGTLLIDSTEVAYGLFEGKNLTSYAEGKMDKWSYSVDQVSVEVIKGDTEGPMLKGNILTPIFTDPFAYEGSMSQYSTTNAVVDVDVPVQKYDMAMWQANFEGEKESKIALEIKEINDKKEFYPSGSFTGELSTDLDAVAFTKALRGNVAEKLSDIQSALELDSDVMNFKLRGIKIDKFTIDPYALPGEKYNTNNIDVSEAYLEMNQKSYEIKQAKIIHIENEGSDPERMGLEVVVKHDNNKIKFTIWSKEENGKFVFDYIEEKIIEISCNCEELEEGTDKDGLGAIIDMLIERDYAYLFEDQISQGSLDAFGVNKSNTTWKEILRQTLKLKMESEAVSGFPYIEGNIYVPFLDEYFQVVKRSDGKLTTSGARPVSGRMTETDGTLAKPRVFSKIYGYELTPDRFQKLGFHVDYNLPEGAVFSIHEMVFDPCTECTEADPWAAGTIHMELNYEFKSHNGVKNKLQFKKTGIAFTPQSLALVNLQFDAIKASSFNPNLSDVTEKLSYVTEGSYVKIDCEKGLHYFKINGIYKTKKLTPLIVKVEEKEEPAKGEEAATDAAEEEEEGDEEADYEAMTEFGFTVNTSTLGLNNDLTNYIAVVNNNNYKELVGWETYSKPRDWKFCVPHNEHLRFQAGSNYLVYFDNSTRHKVPSSFTSQSHGLATSSNDFRGIVFESMEFNILGVVTSEEEDFVLPIEDVIFKIGDTDADTGLYGSFLGEKLITEADNAKLAGWGFQLDDASFTIDNNKFVYDLEIDGSILVPLFEANPTPVSSVDFVPGWIPYNGSIYAARLNSQDFIMSNISILRPHEKIYKSAFIPGLGFNLSKGSSLEMLFNFQEMEWDVAGEFQGLGVVVINDETLNGLSIPAPSGIDFSFQKLQFEKLTLNKVSDNCGDELTHATGIKSIEFGVWGIKDYTADFEEKLAEYEAKKKAKAAAEAEKAKASAPKGRARSNALTKSDSRRPKPKTRARSNALTKNDPRRPKPKTRARSNAITKATPRPNALQPKHKSAHFNSMDISVSTPGVTCKNDFYELALVVGIHILGETRTSQGTATKSKSCSFGADTQIGIQFGMNEAKDDLVYKGIDLRCITINAELGPVAVEGGLNILDSGGSEGTQWGDGFKAYLTANLEGMGGFRALGQFGRIPERDGKEAFKYGFIDIEGWKNSGFPIPPPITGTPTIDLYGLGAAVRVNMKLQNEVLATVQKKNEIKHDDNDNCTIAPDLLAAGKTLTGNTYFPEKGTLGLSGRLMLGPYNEADNIPGKEIYSSLFEPEVDIQLDRNKTTNELQFGALTISVSGFIKPESIGERATKNIGDGKIAATFDRTNRLFSADLKWRLNLPAPVGDYSVIKAPVDYPEYNTGYLLFDFDNREGKKTSYTIKLGGSSKGDYVSTSQLRYSSGFINLKPYPKLTIEAYLQIGNAVDAVTPLEELIPQLKQENALKGGDSSSGVSMAAAADGISFGAGIKVESSGSFGPLSARLEAGVGLNLSLRNLEGVSCIGQDGPIGMNGWYGVGQAYAYAKGDVNLDYSLAFKSGTVKILSVNAFMYLKAMLPNPAYMKGRLSGGYSVLNGLLKGDFNYKFEIGEKCEGLSPKSPIEGMSIFASSDPMDDETISKYGDVNIATNITLGKQFEINAENADGTVTGIDIYGAFLKSIKVIEKDNPSVVVRTITDNHRDNNGFKISFPDGLKGDTKYKLVYSFIWRKKENGAWIDKFLSGKPGDGSKLPKVENGEILFNTAPAPVTIEPQMVEFQAPGLNQRYWHKDYANTELKFKLNALADAANLFPDVCEPCGLVDGQPVKYNYQVELTEYVGGVMKTSYEIPITSHPHQSEMSTITKMDNVPIGNFKIPVLKEVSVPTSKITFPDLNDKIQLTKGAMYDLQIIRFPVINSTATEATTEVVNETTTASASTGSELSADNDNVILAQKITTRKLSTSSSELVQANTKILYKYSFAVSNYDGLKDKMALVTVQHKKSVIKRRDFQHPDDSFDAQRVNVISKYGDSPFHSTLDDYYAIKINNNNLEGFDKYDLQRIRLNTTLRYADTYGAANTITDRYNDLSIDANFEKWLNTPDNKDIGGYMTKVLRDHSKEKITYGSNVRSDGTDWHYNFSIPSDPKANELQADEIRDHIVKYKEGYSSKSDPNFTTDVFAQEVEYDLLLQDLRSRIVINQMFWLSKLSMAYISNYHHVMSKNFTLKYLAIHTYKYNPDILNTWAWGNWSEGEFREGDVRDFSWITRDGGTIAKQPGYKFSYHGGSFLDFPTQEKWAAMDQNAKGVGTQVSCRRFQPYRAVGVTDEFAISSYTELLTDQWYKIKMNGQPLSATRATKAVIDEWHKVQEIHTKFGFDKPGSGGTNTYHILASGNGLYVGDKRYLEYSKVKNDENHGGDSKWGITRAANGMVNIKNKKEEKKFFNFPNQSNYNPNMEIVEIPDLDFNQVKNYRVSAMKNDNSYGEKWLDMNFQKVGRYWKIKVTNSGVPNGNLVGTTRDGDMLNNRSWGVTTVSDEDFRNRRGTAKLEALWNITDLGGGVFVIRNAAFTEHFLIYKKDQKVNLGFTMMKLPDGFYMERPDFSENNPYQKLKFFIYK